MSSAPRQQQASSQQILQKPQQPSRSNNEDGGHRASHLSPRSYRHHNRRSRSLDSLHSSPGPRSPSRTRRFSATPLKRIDEEREPQKVDRARLNEEIKRVSLSIDTRGEGTSRASQQELEKREGLLRLGHYLDGGKFGRFPSFRSPILDPPAGPSAQPDPGSPDTLPGKGYTPRTTISEVLHDQISDSRELSLIDLSPAVHQKGKLPERPHASQQRLAISPTSRPQVYDPGPGPSPNCNVLSQLGYRNVGFSTQTEPKEILRPCEGLCIEQRICPPDPSNALAVTRNHGRNPYGPGYLKENEKYITRTEYWDGWSLEPHSPSQWRETVSPGISVAPAPDCVSKKHTLPGSRLQGKKVLARSETTSAAPSTGIDTGSSSDEVQATGVTDKSIYDKDSHFSRAHDPEHAGAQLRLLSTFNPRTAFPLRLAPGDAGDLNDLDNYSDAERLVLRLKYMINRRESDPIHDTQPDFNLEITRLDAEIRDHLDDMEKHVTVSHPDAHQFSDPPPHATDPGLLYPRALRLRRRRNSRERFPVNPLPSSRKFIPIRGSSLSFSGSYAARDKYGEGSREKRKGPTGPIQQLQEMKPLAQTRKQDRRYS
ncbi:hypothetical protein F5Y15DRAFT_430502 [Xylariaceae sp. FL0016]|nr:hypothetical protein F5Y15DRAFT_430502 [Xylariaceae sp. FL0016]